MVNNIRGIVGRILWRIIGENSGCNGSSTIIISSYDLWLNILLIIHKKIHIRTRVFLSAPLNQIKLLLILLLLLFPLLLH